MAMRLPATDGPQSKTPEQVQGDKPLARENLAPAAALTGDVVQRGRKHPGFRPTVVQPSEAPPSTIETPPTGTEPQEPVPLVMQNAKTPPGALSDEHILAPDPRDRPHDRLLSVEVEGDGETDSSVKWFKLLKNAVLCLAVFWVGIIITVLVL